VKRVGAVAVSAVVVLASAGSAGAARTALEVRLSVKPNSPRALEPARIELRTYLPRVRADGSCCWLQPGGPPAYPFRVEATSPAGKTSRVRLAQSQGNLWQGTFRFPLPGRWLVRVVNSDVPNPLPGARPRLWVRIRPAAATPPPPGFGPLGRAGCSPPSPANPEVTGFRDVFGTAVGGERIWALPFLPGGEWARTDAAVFDGVAGKVMKIVFRMREYHAFSAVGPDGTASKPAWGPVAHSDSNWNRPGREWGAGFLLSEPGCWRIRAGRVGDVWLLIRS
jgi:hypothetical protein